MRPTCAWSIRKALADDDIARLETLALAEDVSRQVNLDSNDHFLLNNLAWFVVTHPDTSGQYPEAKDAVGWAQRACELLQNTPSYTGHLNTLGVARYRNGQWEEAIKALEQSIREGSVRPGNWLFIAMCHWKLEHWKEAREWYDKALAWEQENESDADLRNFFAEAEELMALETPDSESSKDPAVLTIQRPDGRRSPRISRHRMIASGEPAA